MYAFFKGVVEGVLADRVVLDVQGVGYELQATSRTLGGLVVGKATKLLTYLAVREDALTLYGFGDVAEQAMFVRLLTVSGVGPKLALSLLSTFSPAEVAGAISANQPATLARASGVGRKMAEKMIVELKDKLGTLPLGAGGVALVAPVAGLGGVQGEVVSALVNLGFVEKVAVGAVEKAVKEVADGGFEGLFRVALRYAGN